MLVSVEILYHWRCDRCQKWWTVADISPDTQSWYYCPHCGNRSKVTLMQNGSGDRVIGVNWKLPEEVA